MSVTEMQFDGHPFAVVTGGSSGIGREVAKELARRGYDVLIAAEKGLDEAAGEISAQGAHVETCEVDLATPQGVEQLAQRVENRPVDVLALNAGIGVGGGDFTQTSLDDELRMIDLNVRSTVHLAKRVVPSMVARGKGHVLVTSSIAGLMATPYETVYGATKAFDKAFAAALRYEFKDKGLTVTTMMPGPTDTEFFDRAGMQETSVGSDDSQKADPADVAKQGVDALFAGESEVIAGPFKTKMEGTMAKVLPEGVTASRHGKMAAPGSAEQ